MALICSLCGILVLVRPASLSAQAAAGKSEFTEARRPQLQAEAGRLWQEAQRLDAEAKLNEALAAGERLRAADRQLLGAHPDVAFDLAWLAKRYEARENFPAARRARQEALDVQTHFAWQ